MVAPLTFAECCQKLIDPPLNLLDGFTL
jgi:hypothetical protein